MFITQGRLKVKDWIINAGAALLLSVIMPEPILRAQLKNELLYKLN